MADVNIVDIAAGLKDDVVAGIIMNFARQSAVMENIPFNDVSSFTDTQWSVDSLSEANFRSIGNSFAEVKDNPREIQDSVAFLGAQIDIDRALLKPTTHDVDVYADNVEWQSERFKYTFSDTFVNGDRNASPDKFDGLKKRVADLVADGHTDARVDGASGDVLDVSSSSATRQTFLDKINEANFNIADGKSDLIITGKEGYLTLEAVARREGLLDTTQDSFDRDVKTFGGTRIDFIGTKADQTTQIITTTEDPGDAGNDSTSFYFVRFARPYLTGIQLNPPERVFDDLTDDGVTHRVVFEWPLGLASKHKRAIVRLTNIKPFFV